MIHEEHNDPGAIIPSLSLDLARPLFVDLGLAPDQDSVVSISDAYKETLRAADFSNDHARLWQVLTETAPRRLPGDLADHVISWNHDAYTGYHPANPDISWASILLRFARGRAGWPDIGQTVDQQHQFDEFAEFFLRIWDRDAFNARLDDIEQADPASTWDQDVFMRYGMVPFDDDGHDPLAPLKPVWKGQALRRAVREFRFDARPDFPQELLRKAGQIEADKGWMPPGVPLGLVRDIT